MGFLSFLFAPPEPTGPAPRMPLRRFSPMTDLPPHDYVCIDTETTGLDARTCELLEIAAIRYRNHEEVDRFQTYIRPEGAIPRAVSKINHITWSKVYRAPALADVIGSFFQFVGEDILVGYNIGFDIKFIQTRTGDDIKNISFDVLPFVRDVFPDFTQYKLDTLRYHFGLGGSAHSAIGDCIATAGLLQRCMSTPKGQTLMALTLEEEQKRTAAYERCQAEYEKERQERLEIKSRRESLKSCDPPASEMKKMSKAMLGTNTDYAEIIKELLSANGRDVTKFRLLERTYYGYQSFAYCVVPFGGIKTDGNLKYLVLNLAREELKIDFTCALASLSEGTFASRIFVSSPKDLLQLETYILRCFDAADYKYHESMLLHLVDENSTI